VAAKTKADHSVLRRVADRDAELCQSVRAETAEVLNIGTSICLPSLAVATKDTKDSESAHRIEKIVMAKNSRRPVCGNPRCRRRQADLWHRRDSLNGLTDSIRRQGKIEMGGMCGTRRSLPLRPVPKRTSPASLRLCRELRPRQSAPHQWPVRLSEVARPVLAIAAQIPSAELAPDIFRKPSRESIQECITIVS